ncbi:capsular biosynthesis protein [Escherichia coli]|nr:capsular biosynthesis protein [Escherichia coli]
MLNQQVMRAVNQDVVNKMKMYKELGYTITIFTARNMNTFSGNIGKINVHTMPVIIDWLNRNNIPYDEIIVGKPWCGTNGFYVDDKAIRPSEFISLSETEIAELLDKEVKK